MRRSNQPTLSNFLEDFWDTRGLSTDRSPISMPAVNVCETDEQFRIDVAAPGFNKEDFNLHVENNMLTISSEKQLEDKKEEENVSRREFSYGAFQRTFTLPASANADKINAKYNNGVLVINIPKKEEAKAKPPKRIDIR
ncbi:Hsp20/alpha crystallin family protein [Nafulsella turpanensis]|uniref:Hsp20/alpha crystallin family protein n=1 Tax=Nafulsella turpanensis TaxID=1265690 RepID=UPI00035DA024|nr:Hsp20/alpha crystallin family protein [Nafulsella turpanensis]